MPPKGIKDPTPTNKARLVNAVLNPVVFGCIGAASAHQFFFDHIRRLVPLEAVDWQWSAAVAALGASAGLCTWWSARAIRRVVLRSLLSYRGFLHNPTSTKTKLWGFAVWILIGPGPHGLYDFQPLMPKQPLPEVEDSLKLYLEIIKPLVSKEEFEQTKELAEQFKKNEAGELQEFLRKKSKGMRSWLADYWLTSSYLALRDPIAINVNFYMSQRIDPKVTENYMARTVISMEALTKYNEMIQNKTLPPDMAMGILPMCMDGVNYMFGSCRIPGEHVDELVTFSESRHCIVISNGVYYRLEMYAKSKWGRLKRLNKSEIQKQLEWIQKQTAGVTKMNKVAALTSQNRTIWAKQRSKLITNPTNAATLKAIEQSLFVQTMEERPPKDYSEQAKYCLAGNGYNRWFDKGMTLENFQGTSRAGCNIEHSGADATHYNVMWEHTLQAEKFCPDGNFILEKGETCRDLDPPQKLDWDFDEEAENWIDEAYTKYMDTVNDLDIVVKSSDFGRKCMKSNNVSPDGFLQMAIQLAYYRMHKHFTKTYEPASHRLFDQGRTENINPVSEESIRFVHLMDDSNASTEDKIKALKSAIRKQSSNRLVCTAGQGCERHLLGLRIAAQALGMDTPAIFRDKSYSLPTRLSTSQVPTILGHLKIPLLPESLVGGFGPPCYDGYGVLYCCAGEKMFNFSITSWRSCPETDSEKLTAAIMTAMQDMRQMLEHRFD